MTSPRQSLFGNLLLSLSVASLLLGGLEGFFRYREGRRPAPVVEDYIWNWEKKWEGEFYTIRSDVNGWPPWEEFNADGVRDRMHPVGKPEGVFRLMFLGDSVTLGAGLKPQEAYPQVLQARFDEEGRPAEVFNLALWGWSTRQERLAWTKLGCKYRPDLVVLGVCLNDVPELQNNLAQPPRWITALHERSALVRGIVNAPGREIQSVEQLFVSPEPAKVTEGFDRFFAELRSLRDEVRAEGAEFAVLVFPFRFQVLAGAPAPTAQARIAEFCGREGLRCLDLLPAVAKAGGSAFVDYDHFSAQGAQIVAEEVQRAGLLPATLVSARERLAAFAPAHEGNALAAWLDGKGSGQSALSALQSALHDGDAEIRRSAAWAAARLGSEGSTLLPHLTMALGEAEEEVRRQAAQALGTTGGAGERSIGALFRALADERESVRWEAALALAKLKLAAPRDVPALMAALRSADAYVRGFAAWSLGGMGPAAREAIPALIEALDGEDGYGRGGAAAALAKMGPVAKGAVPALMRGLQSDDGDRRWKAARTLGRIGPAAEGAVPLLIRALSDPNEHVRSHAARALGRIGGEGVVPALEEATRDPVDEVRREAKAALDAARAR